MSSTTLTPDENKIMETFFKEIIPNLGDQEKKQLLCFAQGAAFISSISTKQENVANGNV